MTLKIESFEDLIVWQKSHRLVLMTYELTKDFPDAEKYGLISQMRRCAISVPANIAEGFRKRGVADQKRFFNISHGSLDELRYYLILARDLNYAVQEQLSPLQNILKEISKMLFTMVKK